MKHEKEKPLTKKEYKRFLSKISPPASIDSCWIWEAGLDIGNYGKFCIRNRTLMAHRVSYAIFNGPIPDGLIVRHRCDTPSCVNPRHLVVGTHSDNMQDLSDKIKANKFHGMSRMDYELMEAMVPRSNKFENFGPEYEQLLLRAYNAIFVEKLQEFTIQFPNAKLANSIRMRMYTYWRVLKTSGKRPDLLFQCQYLSMRVAGSALEFYHVNEDSEAKALREALKLDDGFADGTDTRGVIAPQTGLSSHLDKLASIRARKKHEK